MDGRDVANGHVKKGTQVIVQARVHTRMVEDRGENRQRVGFVVESLRLGSNGALAAVAPPAARPPMRSRRPSDAAPAARRPRPRAHRLD
jgi:single-stranded DNA-binding protein